MRLAALVLAATYCAGLYAGQAPGAQNSQAPGAQDSSVQNASDGAAAYRAFQAWQKLPANAQLKWEETVARYRRKLAAEGLTAAAVERTMRVIEARDEAALYDPIYAGAPEFETRPNALLVEAVAQRGPGRALDVGMGQGRNALHLARKGWEVTGFDVAAEGLAAARKQAAAERLTIETVHASDEEFEFGAERWDLIAILYPIEKRSVFRVARALKPGGLVVIECGHRGTDGAPFEYGDNELLEIFKEFLILKYEDTVAVHDWVRKPMQMVRLIARKR